MQGATSRLLPLKHSDIYFAPVSIDRLDTLNVSKWSMVLQNSINALPEWTHNLAFCRDRDTMRLYAKLALYESIKEATSILELYLWRLKIDESLPSPTVVQGSQKREKVDNHISQRSRCRINCGADIIVPGVLAYLVPKL